MKLLKAEGFGCFRTMEDIQNFATIMSFIGTARKLNNPPTLSGIRTNMVYLLSMLSKMLSMPILFPLIHSFRLNSYDIA